MNADPIDRLPTLSLEKALARIDACTRTLPSEEVAVADALDRMLAVEAVAALDYPPADRAAMDGWALRSADTVGASAYGPLTLATSGADGLPPNAAAPVQAGERLPAGADCVAPPEVSQPGAPGTIDIIEPVAPENGIERGASHFARGSILLGPGRRLRASDLALLAVAGIARVAVTRQPRIAILTTGTGSAEAAATAAMLVPLLERDGGCIAETRNVERAPAVIRQAGAIPTADVVLVAGGPTRGRDRIFLAACESTPDFAEVALAPGGSMAMGTIGGAMAFSLPAAPVACFCAYEIVVARVVRRLAGHSLSMPFQKVPLKLMRKIVSAIGTTEICLVRRQEDGVEPLTGASPFNLLALARADGFVIVAEGSEGMPAGTAAPVRLFELAPVNIAS